MPGVVVGCINLIKCEFRHDDVAEPGLYDDGVPGVRLEPGDYNRGPRKLHLRCIGRLSPTANKN